MPTETQTADPGPDRTGARRSRDRDQTERQLAQAALEMIGSDGVLGGINLRDVAERAGVARASIYNFFGSRRQLLRRALALRVGELDDAHGVSPLPFVERKMRLVGDENNALHAQLVTLLVIDGDEEILPMPFFEGAMERMQSDLEEERIDPSHASDLEALHIAIHSATRGYNVLRKAYARQLGVTVEDLDSRVRVVFEAGLRGLAEPTPSTGGRR